MTTITRTHACLALCCVLLVGFGSLPTGASMPGAELAQEENQPTDAEEFIQAFDEREGSEVTEEYSELEIIRSQAVQDAQVGNFTSETQARLELVWQLFNAFEAAHHAEQEGSYDDSLTNASEARGLVTELRDAPGGEQYASASAVALDRFYEELGESLLALAEETAETPERITLLSQSATAFDEAGDADRFAEVELQADETQQEFENDYEQLNESSETVETFVSACEDCDSVIDRVTADPLSVFDEYVDSREAVDAGEEATGIADRHNLDDEQEAIAGPYEEAQSNQGTLAMASATVVLSYSAAVGIVAAILLWRLLHWRRDLFAAKRGDVILMGEMYDG